MPCVASGIPRQTERRRPAYGAGVPGTPERLTALLSTIFPTRLCFACLAAELGAEEGEVRNAAQGISLERRPGFELAHGVCSRCSRDDDLLTFSAKP
jgi:hypothetical protein